MNTNSESTIGGKPADVYFFGTCLLDIFMPEAGLDAVTLPTLPAIRRKRPTSPPPSSICFPKTGRLSCPQARAAA